MIKIKHLILVLILALAVGSFHHVHAQGEPEAGTSSQSTELAGDWLLNFFMSDADIRSLPVALKLVDGSIHMYSGGEDSPAAFATSWDGDVLTSDVDLGHGTIRCILKLDDEDSFDGACVGPQAEIPATLTRAPTAAE